MYFLFGDEILLVEETLDLLRKAAREAEYTERTRYTVEAGFDWNQIFSGNQSMSLFAERKIVELRIPTGKPGDAGGKALTEYANSPPAADTILVVIAGGIERRSQSTKWFKALEQAAVTTECPTIAKDNLPQWISDRLQRQNLQFDQDVVALLAYYVEGNLLAAAQEINLLTLLATDGRVTTELVENAIADHARFSPFSFADACLSGAAHRVTRILQSLKQEQSEPILILWALTRETRTLCNLAAIREQGGNPGGAYKRLGVWGPRTRLIGAALQRLSLKQSQTLLRKLARADLQLKGRTPMQKGDIWEEIESIALELCGVRIP